MYIKANHFNYDTLLAGLVEHLDLQDTPLDDQMLAKIFKDFETRHKARRSACKLEEWQEKIVVEFLNSVQFVQCAIGVKTDDEYEEPSSSDFYELLANLLDTLVDCITATNNDDLIEYLDCFLRRLYSGNIEGVTFTDDDTFTLANGAVLDAEQFANFLRDWTETYLTDEISDLDKFLLFHLNGNIGVTEYMKDITVLDIPGPKARHGDSVIGFPSILLEVYNT